MNAFRIAAVSAVSAVFTLPFVAAFTLIFTR